MQVKVSVIIPVYNMAEWIGPAIDSVEKQTIKEIEILCVDDGSTDITADILRQYEKKYDNLVVLFQRNQGAGPARNYGIKKAKGEYVAFLDADDYYFTENALEALYNKAQEQHAVICRGSSCDDRNGMLCFDGLRPERVFQQEGYISKEEFPGPTGYWASIYNREFLLREKIKFPNLRRGQDGVFSTDAIVHAGKVYCLDKVVYVYRKEHKTVVYSEEKAVDAVRTMYELLRIAAAGGARGIYSSWKKELFGEQLAMLYKYAAMGNADMLDLAAKLNHLIGGGLYEGKEIASYVDHVQEEKQRFLEKLKEKEAVYVFGAGTLGRRVISWLHTQEVYPKAVIVTNPEQNPSDVDGVLVQSIDSINCHQDHIVIIATFPYLQESIIMSLRKEGVENYYPIDICKFQLWQDNITH